MLLGEIHHREARVVRHASVRIELHAVALDEAVLRHRRGEVSLIGMPLSDRRHVGVAVEDEPHGAVELPGGDRHRGRDDGRPELLAAEAAAEGPLEHDDVAVADAQYRGDRALHAGALLRPRVDRHPALLAGDRDAGLRLHVEVRLPFVAHLAFDRDAAFHRCPGMTEPPGVAAFAADEGDVHVADLGLVLEESLTTRQRERLLDREHRGLVVVLDHRVLDERRRALGGPAVCRHDECDRLAPAHHLTVEGEDRVVVAQADLRLAGDVVDGDERDESGEPLGDDALDVLHAATEPELRLCAGAEHVRRFVAVRRQRQILRVLLLAGSLDERGRLQNRLAELGLRTDTR